LAERNNTSALAALGTSLAGGARLKARQNRYASPLESKATDGSPEASQ
jgi:hypothetical protein